MRAALALLVISVTAAAAPGPPAGAGAPAVSPSPLPSPAGSVRFAPKAPAGSSATLDVRFELETRDVTYDVPPAYKDSFGFWTKRMKGSKRSELFQYVGVTDDPEADGAVHFRKQLARYQVDVLQGGESLTPFDQAVKDMQSLVWEGHLDRFGNVKESHLVAGRQDPEMADSGISWVEAFFPRVEGERDLKAGDGITAVDSLPLPSQLNIQGLEKVRVLVTRVLTFRTIEGGQARFEMKTTYATDPSTKPTADGTSCVIGGNGTGDAAFDLKRGVFVASRQASTLTLDIEAPLRPLPEHPETENAGPGRSHLELGINYNGQQVVHKILGED
jgi:hypothetical protein